MNHDQHNKPVIDLQVLDGTAIANDWLEAAGWANDFILLGRAVGMNMKSWPPFKLWLGLMDYIGAAGPRLALTAYGQGVCYG